MKKLSAFALSLGLLCSGSSRADVTLPYGITPLNGEVRLLYRPGFESTCTVGNGADQTDTPLTSITTLKLDASGQFTYSITMDDGTVMVDVNADGAGINKNSMRFLNKDSKSNDLFVNLFKTLPPGYGVIGKSLRHGSDVPSVDICENIPGGRSNFFSTMSRKVVGTVVIHGRPSLIIATNFKSTCTVEKMGQTGQISFNGGGWESFDFQSGLTGSGASHMSIKFWDNPEANMDITSSCIISDTAQAATADNGKSLEERLTELKGLKEKGLITQDQYEQKRADILKAL